MRSILPPPERWQEIDLLFQAALERPVAAREAFLEQASRGDAALAREVQALLDSDAEAELMLGDSATAYAAPLLDVLPEELAAADSRGFPAADSRLGAYRIIREIGRGGMGAVYLAERADEEFEKRVAIKLVKRGMDTDEVLRRFRAERQILASLEHPNIARLHDGGVSEDGRPYLVMEYIEGRPLTAYCDEHRLGVEERLALFQTVCQAVQYAHQNLVVHRDLKPSNVLVTEQGEVKLLDFGIAKLLDDDAQGAASQTRTGARVLTPDYASPEQLRGRPVTTASDAYSLGVVLYELLTDRRPFYHAAPRGFGVEQPVLEGEAKRPSAAVMRGDQHGESGAGRDRATPEVIAAARGTTPDRLRRRLRGDLDTITLKALESEPDRRYASAAALLDDIDRHLNRLPVAARRDTTRYRAAQFVRRHQAGVLAAALVLLALVGGLGAALWQAERAAHERDIAKQERDTATQVGEFLVELFTTSDPSVSRGQAITARDLLDKGAQRVDRELTNYPEVRARMMGVMGQAYLGLGLYNQATRLLEGALAIRRQVHGGDHPEVAATLHDLAYLLRDQGRFSDSEPLFRESLAMRRRLFGDEHLDVVISLNGLAYLLRGRGDFAESAVLYREALATGRKLFGAAHRQIIVSLNGLAAAHFQQGDYKGAEPLFREALEMTRTRLGEDHPDVPMVLYNLAKVLHETGDLEESESFYREAIALGRKVRGDRHPLGAMSLMGLADALRDKGDLDGAEPLYRQALQIQRRALPPGHDRTATTLIGFGRLLIDRGTPREAEPLVREAMVIRRQKLLRGHYLIAEAESALGACLSAQGRFDEAEPLLSGSYRTLGAARGAKDNLTRQARERLVDHYRRSGRPDRIALLGAAA